MPETLDHKQLTQLINAVYTRDELNNFFRGFLRKFIIDHGGVCREHGVPTDIARKPNPGKGELAACLVPFFLHGELFRKMKRALPGRLPEIVEKVVWEGPQDHETLEKEFGMKVAYTNQELATSYPKPLDELESVFCLFKDAYSYRNAYYWGSYNRELKNETTYLHLLLFPPALSARLKNFLDKPAGFELQPLLKPELPDQVYTDHESIFSELPVALSYLQQGKLAISDSGTVAVGSINKMRKYCGIKEFYPDQQDKYAASLRTRFIIELLLTLDRAGLSAYTEPVPYLKTGFNLYQKGRLSPVSKLFHLKGWNKVQDNEHVNRIMFGLLRELPLGQWVSAENLRQYALYRDLPLQVVPESQAGSYLYLEGEGQYGKEKHYVRRAHYHWLITEPLLRGSFFLYATFGLVDLAYGPPANPLAEKIGRAYLSAYDGLRYVRLTPLGAYLCGLTNTYEAPVTQDEDILLDEQNLFISYKGDNKPLLSILDKVAHKASDYLYKVDYESLLGDCHTKKEIAAKINIFRQLLSANPPPIWKDFFETLQKKTFQLPSLEEEYKVFQLPDHKELIRLVASDEFLKKHVIKAEMYYVIIPKGNVTKVKNYLKKFGFLVDFG